MRIALVRPPVVHLARDLYGSIPGIPSGIAYLAAAVRAAGHETRIVDAYGLAPHRFYRFRRRYLARGLTPAEAVRVIEPGTEVIGISVHCATEHSMSLALLSEARAAFPEARLVVGGYHATFVPEDFLAGGADFVVLGEGENRLPALLRALESGLSAGEIEGIAAPGRINPRTSPPIELDPMPFAAFDLLPLETYWRLRYGHGPWAGRYVNMITSRGCPYHCSFCQAPLMSGGRWTSKSASRVLEEIEWYSGEYGVGDFHIQDENFATDRARVERICAGLSAREDPVSFCFPSGLKMETIDGDLLELMAGAGCRYISLSPETGSRRVLALMNKTADLERVPGLFRKAGGLGIRSCAFMATGYPGETPFDRRRTLSYVFRLARSGADEMVMPIVTPFPATESMKEELLQGFSEMDELCFSPVWRRDYARLDIYRNLAYIVFGLGRVLFHPLRAAAGILRVLRGRFGTKTEMTVWRKVRDLPDIAAALARGDLLAGRHTGARERGSS